MISSHIKLSGKVSLLMDMLLPEMEENYDSSLKKTKLIILENLFQN